MQIVSDAQFEILEYLWDNPDGAVPMEVHKGVGAGRDPSTTYTLLTRLANKGLVVADNDRRYRAVITRKEMFNMALSRLEITFPYEYATMFRQGGAKAA